MNPEATLTLFDTVFTSLPDQVEKLEDQMGLTLQRKINAESNLAEIGLAKEFYKKAVDVLYQSSVGELEKVVNLALEFIFVDSKFRVGFETSEARGVKTLNISLRDESVDPPLEMDCKDGTGAGIRSVISAVLHAFYIINKKAYPVLFLDETYSAISAEYVDRFFTFLKGLCEKKDFHIVMITHDPRYLDYGDKRYRVREGRVEEVLDSKASDESIVAEVT